MNFLAAIYWNVSPDIIHLGPFTIRWYGLLFALGFVIGYEIVSWIFRIEVKPKKDLEALTITMILSTVIGARLGHCLFYEPDIYLSNPMEILYIWKGGLASHGAAIGILIGEPGRTNSTLSGL
jgi:prolipoprotein diacylglyceryl transferase